MNPDYINVICVIVAHVPCFYALAGEIKFI